MNSNQCYLGLDISSKGARYAITSDNQTFERGDVTLKTVEGLFDQFQVIAASCEYTGRLGRAWADLIRAKSISFYFIHTVERRAINRLQGEANKTDDRDAIGIAGMLYLWAHEGRRSQLGLANHLFIDAALVDKAWTLRALLASVDQLIDQRRRAKQRIGAAEKAGSEQIANIWRVEASSTAPDQALAAAEKFASDEFGEELRLLKTIPGVGDRTATYLLAQLVPLERFAEIDAKGNDRSLRNLKRYSGMYPRLRQSGEISETARMAKVGNPKLRALCYMGALGSVTLKNKLGRFYERRKEGGMPGKKAIVAMSIKLLGIAWAILRDRKPYFDAQCPPKPEKPAMPEGLMSQADAAVLIGTSRQRIGQLLASGHLEAIEWEGKRLVSGEAAKRYREATDAKKAAREQKRKEKQKQSGAASEPRQIKAI